jgi:excisionase family DNA binding protein
MSDEKYVSVQQASEILNVSDRQIRRYCNDGKLEYVMEGKAFLVDRESLSQFARERSDMDASSTIPNINQMSDDDQSVSDSGVRSMSDENVTDDTDTDVELSDEVSDVHMSDAHRVFLDEIRMIIDEHEQQEMEYHNALRTSFRKLVSVLSEEYAQEQRFNRGFNDLIHQFRTSKIKADEATTELVN